MQAEGDSPKMQQSRDLAGKSCRAMEFGKKKKSQAYPIRLQLYKTPPVDIISLQEFEELALQRLKLLQEIEKIRQQSTHEGVHKDGPEYRAKIETAMKDYMPLSPVDDHGLKLKHIEERRRDHLSHYILRLAYCRTEDMRRWFLSQETELLRCRFLKAVRKDRDEFFNFYKEDFNFQCEVIPLQETIKDNIKEEKTKDYPNKEVIDKLSELLLLSEEVYQFSINPPPDEPYCFYKVPFTCALDLVQSRQVVVKKGYVYVPEIAEDMIVSLVCNKFRARVSGELVKTLHHLAVVDDDERIAPLLKNLKHRYLGEDFQFSGKISLGQVDTLARESFPPCMRHLHEALRRDHHLRHFGRLQYGLFLKSIGLTLEQALTFWRAEFTKKMEPDKFEKQYAYNVRHSYGKEGKRADYTAYSCTKIILSNAPGQGDSHGCPFRHWDKEHLQRMLTAHGISKSGSNKILDYVENSHYQLACQKYFEITHGLADSFSLEHPTQFFIQSRGIREGGMVGPRDLKQEEEEPQAMAEAGTDFGDISELDLVGGFEEDMETS